MTAGAGAIKAGQAYVELTTDDKPLGDGLRAASKQLKGWAKAMKGAGAAYALTFIADQANKLADGIEKVQEGVAKGELSAGQAVGETANQLMKAIPIAGKWYEIGQRIRGMLDGSTAAQKKLNAELEKHVALRDRQREAHAEQVKLTREAMAEAVKLRRGVLLALAPDEAAKITLQAEFDYSDAQQKLAELRAKVAAWQKDPILAKSNRGEIEELEKVIRTLEWAADNQRGLGKIEADKARHAERDQLIGDLVRQAADAGLSEHDQTLRRLQALGVTEGRGLEFAREKLAAIRAAENADREQANADRLHELRVASIEDEYQRSLVAIDARYEVERRQAERLGLDLSKIDQARAWERYHLDLEWYRQRVQAEKSVQDEIARLQIETTMKGRAKELALLALEEKTAREELVKVGGNPELIRQLFELRRKLVEDVKPLDTRTLAVAGTFNAVEAFHMGGGPATDRIAKATEETAKNTKRLVDEALGITFR